MFLSTRFPLKLPLPQPLPGGLVSTFPPLSRQISMTWIHLLVYISGSLIFVWKRLNTFFWSILWPSFSLRFHEKITPSCSAFCDCYNISRMSSWTLGCGLSPQLHRRSSKGLVGAFPSCPPPPFSPSKQLRNLHAVNEPGWTFGRKSQLTYLLGDRRRPFYPQVHAAQSHSPFLILQACKQRYIMSFHFPLKNLFLTINTSSKFQPRSSLDLLKRYFPSIFPVILTF